MTQPQSSPASSANNLQWLAPRGLRHLSHLLAVRGAPDKERTLEGYKTQLALRMAPLAQAEFPSLDDQQSLLAQVAEKLGDPAPIEASDPPLPGLSQHLTMISGVLGYEAVELLLASLLRAGTNKDPVDLVPVAPPPALSVREWLEGLTDLALTKEAGRLPA